MSHKVGDYRGVENPRDSEHERLRWLARSLDPDTRRQLLELGLTRGWRCLEVGAAEGSMSRWLAEQVGERGRVVAADIDTRFLAELERDPQLPNVEVRELDVRSAELEADHFDLAYCRTVLLHLPEPAQAVRRMVSSLRPGGLFVAGEPDMSLCVSVDPDAPGADTFEHVFRRLYAAIRAKKAFDTAFGRTLPRLLRAVGLQDVESRATARVERGGGPAAQTLLRTLVVLGGRRLIGEDERAAVNAMLADPDFEYLSGVQVFAWGRKPR